MRSKNIFQRNQNYGIFPCFFFSLWDFVLLGYFPTWDFFLMGFCPLGFCPLGFCPHGILSSGILSSWNFFLWDFFLYGIFPRTGGNTTHAGSSAKLPPDKPTTRSTSSKTKTPKHSNVSFASPLSSVPSPVLPTEKRKLPSTDAGPVPKKSTPGLGDLLEARGVRESALAIADSCERH